MKNLLKKCIEELAKQEPKLDYVRGILETLAEQEPEKPIVPPVSSTPVSPNIHPISTGSPEGGAWDVLAPK